MMVTSSADIATLPLSDNRGLIAEGRLAVRENDDEVLFVLMVSQNIPRRVDASLDIRATIVVVVERLSRRVNSFQSVVLVARQLRAHLVVVAEANDRDLVAALLHELVHKGGSGLLGVLKALAATIIHAVGTVHDQNDVGALASLDRLILRDRHRKGDVEVVGPHVGLFHSLGNLDRSVVTAATFVDHFRVLLGGASGIHGKRRDLHQAQAHYQGHEQAQCPLADGLAPGDSLARIVLCHDSFPPSIFNRN